MNEFGETVTKTKLLETLPSIIYEMNVDNVSKLVIEFVGTQFQHRRIRMSTILFGKIIYLDQNKIVSADFSDKTSYACDTLPSRTFKFNVNNYEHIYDVDNPNNGYVSLNDQTIVQFRSGYNVFGYLKDDNDEEKIAKVQKILEEVNSKIDVLKTQWEKEKSSITSVIIFNCGAIIWPAKETHNVGRAVCSCCVFPFS